MELKEAILNRRTRRKFTNKKVEHHKLEELVEYARYAPTGQNLQPLKYCIVDDEEMVKKIFPHTKWSGYHPEDAPTESEQPTAYIAILGDCSIKPSGEFGADAGAAGTIITLAAEDMGLASCWIGSVNKEEVSCLLGLGSNLKLLYVIAIGYSNQLSRSVDANGDIKYFMDNGVLTVPKRTREEILT